MGKNIEIIVRDNLCQGCGTCVSLCPKQAIRLTIDEEKGIYIPKIDRASCDNCGICFNCCPCAFDNLKFLNQVIFGRKPGDPLIGHFLNCYTGYAQDNDIRYHSSSGGVITALLIFALEEEIINGALVTRMQKNKPLEPAPFIARTRQEIIEASRSKYCPVPANIALKEILKSEPKEKFAIVGLPCHILGDRRAEQINKQLNEKIILRLGLFCNHNPNFHATRIFLRKFNIQSKNIIKLHYRGQGWPGYMQVIQADNKLKIPLREYWSFLGATPFIANGCLICNDQTAELADISFGDPWLQDFKSEKVGQSIIISRTQRGEEILQKAKKAKIIELNPVSEKKIISSQLSSIYLKKKNIRGLFGKKIFTNILKPDFLDYLLALLFKLEKFCFQNRWLVRLIPFKVFSFFNTALNNLLYRKSLYDFKKYTE